MNSRLIQVTATIPNGTALSQEINLQDGVNDHRTLSITGVVMPSAWTAAGIGFQLALSSGGIFQAAYDSDDALLEIAVAQASRTYLVNPVATVGMPYLKVWSQTGGTSVNQGAERDIILILRDYS